MCGQILGESGRTMHCDAAAVSRRIALVCAKPHTVTSSKLHSTYILNTAGCPHIDAAPNTLSPCRHIAKPRPTPVVSSRHQPLPSRRKALDGAAAARYRSSTQARGVRRRCGASGRVGQSQGRQQQVGAPTTRGLPGRGWGRIQRQATGRSSKTKSRPEVAGR